MTQAWGNSTFVTKVVPVFIGLSALGNVFAQTFANSRGMPMFPLRHMVEPRLIVYSQAGAGKGRIVSVVAGMGIRLAGTCTFWYVFPMLFAASAHLV